MQDAIQAEFENLANGTPPSLKTADTPAEGRQPAAKSTKSKKGKRVRDLESAVGDTLDEIRDLQALSKPLAPPAPKAKKAPRPKTPKAGAVIEVTEAELAAENERCAKLRTQIKLYNDLPHYNGTVRLDGTETLEQLLKTKTQIEHDLSMSSGPENGRLLVLMACEQYEIHSQNNALINPMGWDIRGFSATIQANSERIYPLFDELVIKYNIGLQLPVEVRLFQTLFGMMHAVHRQNQLEKQNNPKPAESEE